MYPGYLPPPQPHASGQIRCTSTQAQMKRHPIAPQRGSSKCLCWGLSTSQNCTSTLVSTLCLKDLPTRVDSYPVIVRVHKSPNAHKKKKKKPSPLFSPCHPSCHPSCLYSFYSVSPALPLPRREKRASFLMATAQRTTPPPS